MSGLDSIRSINANAARLRIKASLVAAGHSEKVASDEAIRQVIAQDRVNRKSIK